MIHAPAFIIISIVLWKTSLLYLQLTVLSLKMNDLSKQYMCSVWSKRFSNPKDVLNHHYEFAEKACQNVQDEIPNTLNISYGLNPREKIDIYGTNLPKDAPILVFIHGGYWQAKDIGRHTYAFISRTMYKNGTKTIFVGYELCPDVTLAEIVRSIQTAAELSIQYAEENGSKALYFAGHSAGAHLAASVFSSSDKLLSRNGLSIVKGVILLSGVYDLTPIVKTEINEPLKLDEELASKLSPIRNVCNVEKRKFYIFVGEHESPEFIKQSRDFHDKLISVGNDSNLSIVSNVDHFNIVELLSREQFQVTQNIVRLLKE